MTILIVEDDANDTELLLRGLRRMGFAEEVKVVRDGKQAVAYLEGVQGFEDRTLFPRPGLIILDLRLPEMSGMEVLAWLKAHPDFSKIPTVVLSGSPYERDVGDAYRLGAKTFFLKPLGKSGLEGLVGIIDQSRPALGRPPEGPRPPGGE